jgi:cellulose synthase/poly-beta-1,6-N-acetylglucosamine synthase-like glycosyltransferase
VRNADAMTGTSSLATRPGVDHPLAATAAVPLALAWGTLWIVWRIGWSRGDAPLALFVALLAVEVAVWVRLLLFATVTWKVPRAARAVPTRQCSIDVIVATFNEPVGTIRATLLGCRALAFPHRTVVVDDSNRRSVADLAERLGATYLSRPGREGARGDALAYALARTDGELVLVLDGDMVPLPDALHEVVGWFDDPSVGLVQTPQEHANRDSVVDSLGERHERALHHEVLAPAQARLGAGWWEGGAAVLRRAALDDLGGIRLGGETFDLPTSIALHQRGWRAVFHRETVVQGLAPHNLEAFLAERARWARGPVGALRRSPRLVFAPGLSLRQRVVHLQILWEQLTGLVRLATVGVLLAVLLSGRLPFHSSPFELLGLWLPWFALGTASVWILGRGQLGRRDLTRRDAVNLGLQLSALGALFRQGRRRSPVTATGRDTGGLDAISHLGLLTAITIAVEIAVVLRLVDALVGVPLPKQSGLALVLTLVAAAYVLSGYLGALGLFVRRRQRRAVPRVRVDQPARSDGDIVRLRDLSATGGSFISTSPRRPGQTLPLRMALPDLAGRPRPVAAHAVVRTCLPNRDRTRFRIGCEFVDVPADQRDALIEYCSVIRPFQVLRRPAD